MSKGALSSLRTNSCIHPEVLAKGENLIKNALMGKSENFFVGMDTYLSVSDQARVSYYNRGLFTIKRLASENAWKIKEAVLDALDGDYVAMFQALEDLVFVGADMSKDDYPTALYTRNADLLHALAQKGMLDLGDKGSLEPTLDALRGNKTLKAIKDGKFAVIRLDFLKELNGVPIFTPKVPRSTLDIGMGKSFLFIPFDLFLLFESNLEKFIGDKPFIFEKETAHGVKLHKAAISPEVIRKAYTGCSHYAVENKVRKIKCGYDVGQLTYVCQEIEASLETLGIASFRPEMLISIKPIDYTAIDTSQHQINYNYLRGIFRTKVRGAKVGELEPLGIMDLTTYATQKDKIDALSDLSETIKGADLYWLMKKNETFFGNIQEVLATREKMSPKFLKQLAPVELPSETVKRAIELRRLLKIGIAKIVVRRKDNTLYERYCTNNPLVLERMLGKDYVKSYESINSKLKAVESMLQQGIIKTKGDVEKVIVEYNIGDYIDKDLFLSGRKGALQCINTALADLEAKNEARKKPHLVHFRDVYAKDAENLIKQLDVNNIISITYVEVK